MSTLQVKIPDLLLKQVHEIAAKEKVSVDQIVSKALAAQVSVSQTSAGTSGSETGLDSNARPIWQTIAEIGQSLPEKEWETVPTDGARNLDHYLYGAEPK